ncbi:hypothetical protein C0J52_13181 [Blattella germanica]|nr:hypothetical protein C0J52_13181 [Blattella germanica]
MAVLQETRQISRLYYWVCSHFCEQLPLLCGQLMLPALKYLGSEPRQVQETTGGVFGRLNSAPSKELLRNVSQMALVCNKDLTGSVWKGPSEGLHQGRVLKFVAHCCELELKLKEAMTEADALRRDLARKEAAPVLVRRIQRLLEEKDKASMKARDLKACLKETKTKLSAETKRCQDLWWSNLELRLEMKKVREEKDLLEALLAEVMAVVEQKSSSGLQGSLSECAGRHLVP